MNKLALFFFAAMLCSATTLPAHALHRHRDRGKDDWGDWRHCCDDSPENPTALLGIVASAASIGFTQIRNRIGNRRKPER